MQKHWASSDLASSIITYRRCTYKICKMHKQQTNEKKKNVFFHHHDHESTLGRDYLKTVCLIRTGW